MRFPALACAVLSAGSAHAASISVESTGPDKPPVVVVQGSFEGKDGEQFFTKTGSRRDQTHIVADRCKLPADVMGARTGLHADQAARNIGETAYELRQNADKYRSELSEIYGFFSEGFDTTDLVRAEARLRNA